MDLLNLLKTKQNKQTKNKHTNKKTKTNKKKFPMCIILVMPDFRTLSKIVRDLQILTLTVYIQRKQWVTLTKNINYVLLGENKNHAHETCFNKCQVIVLTTKCSYQMLLKGYNSFQRTVDGVYLVQMSNAIFLLTPPAL